MSEEQMTTTETELSPEEIERGIPVEERMIRDAVRIQSETAARGALIRSERETREGAFAEDYTAMTLQTRPDLWPEEDAGEDD